MKRAKKIDGLVFRRLDGWYYFCRSKDHTYTVSLAPGKWFGKDSFTTVYHCNCPAGRRGRECKHVRALKKLLELETELEEELLSAWEEDCPFIEEAFWDAEWDPAWDVPVDTSWREKAYQRYKEKMEAEW